jgi:hypothetical protein
VATGVGVGLVTSDDPPDDDDCAPGAVEEEFGDVGPDVHDASIATTQRIPVATGIRRDRPRAATSAADMDTPYVPRSRGSGDPPDSGRSFMHRVRDVRREVTPGRVAAGARG